MARRMWLMLLVVVLFIAAIGTYKFLQIRAAIASGSNFQQPPEAVTTVVAKQDEWSTSLSGIGTVEAVHGAMLSADLSGVVRSIEFQSGQDVAAGRTLLRLETGQEQAQLAQAQAQLDLANLNLERAKQLLAKALIAQAEFDRIQAGARSAEANVAATRATIARKTVRAPFAGRLGIRQVDLGQRVNEGDAIVSLQAIDPVYVNFSLPQGDVSLLKVGTAVRISADTSQAHAMTGTITAINSVINENTRNIDVQATLRNPGGRLKPGMFVDVAVELGATERVIALPATAINYAPYGNSVYVVENMKNPKGKEYRGVSQRFVQTGRGRGDQIAILSGLKPGEEIVTSGGFKLRPGAAVEVNNTITPANSPNPRPGNS
ncbi:MAG: efflux RND transporter periplasmic adaptor subunit [Candidatus Eisenbacteria bacterium]